MKDIKALFKDLNINYDDNQKLSIQNVDVDVINSSWKVHFTSENLISSDYYVEIENKFISYFSSSVKNIEIHIHPVNNDYSKISKDIIKHYLLFFAKQNSKINNIVSSIKHDIINEGIMFEVTNNFEKNLVDKNIEFLQSSFNKLHLINMSISSEMMAEEAKKEYVEKIQKSIEKKEEKIITKVNTNKKLWGEHITKKTLPIKDVINPDNMINNATIEGEIFSLELRELKKSFLLTIMVADDNGDTVICKTFTGFNKKEPTEMTLSKLSESMRVRLSGRRTYDQYIKDEVIEIVSMEILSKNQSISNRVDDGDDKRVELHMHTKMSKNNAISSLDDYVQLADHFNHKAIAITDHHGVQAFVKAQGLAKKYGIKIIYGVEASIVDNPTIVFNANDNDIQSATYTVFDVETTGLSANMNKLIEIGAVKIENGIVAERYQQFIKIDEKLSAFTTSLTGITDDDLAGGVELKKALEDFQKFSKDTVLVAHNAIFDMQFLARNYEKELNITVDNPVLDTLELSRFLNKDRTYHTLKILSKLYGVALDSKSHHRADYDAEKLMEIFQGMLKQIKELEIKTFNHLNERNDINKSRAKHALVYAKTQNSLKALYELVSLSNTENFFQEPRMLKSDVQRLRDELLIVSSGCQNSEVVDAYLNKSDAEMKKVMDFYDYVEILPPSQYTELINDGTFKNQDQIIEMHKKIIEMADERRIKVVASSNAHFIEPSLYKSKEILLAKDFKPNKLKKNEEGVEEFIDKIRYKKLIDSKSQKIKDQYMKTTEEMLDIFSYLGSDKSREVVITNTNEIADMMDELQIIPDDLYTPEITGVDDKLKDMVYERAKSIYSDNLPEIVEKRLEKEVNSITKYGFSVIYYISHKLVKYSLDNGYLVGSRGSVGSSLVATFMDITEINPLAPHYICLDCCYSEFFEDGKYGSGFDLPNKKCPNCGINMKKDGQDIPFETFLGFEGDKVPDIDLNFSGEFQNKAHEYVRSKETLNDDELFDYHHAYRAGTIGTIAEKTAYAYVRNYLELLDKPTRRSDILHISKSLEGIKRTTGQHPGGIIVIPSHRNVYEFTPVGYPAEDTSQPWQTTHFDFHAIHDNLLKLDILGHDDPTMLKRLKDLTGIDPQTIDVSDEKIMQLFTSVESLNVTSEQIQSDLGTLGVPEFGTNFVMEMLKDTKPKTFSELVQISGLSHGTDVWLGNAKELIDNGTCELKDVIGCRDDIMVYLMYQGLDSLKAFTIMEKVRKGKGLTQDDIDLMEANDVPSWYIDSCQKIKYMFPKAHAAAYVLMALRIAYFKVHYPLEYYAAYFSSRASDFDAASMIRGSESLVNKIKMINDYETDMSDVKRKNTLNTLKMALEMVERGFEFEAFNLEKSSDFDFVINEDHTGLIMPFYTIDGLGEKEAQRIVEQREESPFMTIEDFKKRTKVKKKSFEQLEIFGVFENLEENNQVSLF